MRPILQCPEHPSTIGFRLFGVSLPATAAIHIGRALLTMKGIGQYHRPVFQALVEHALIRQEAAPPWLQKPAYGPLDGDQRLRGRPAKTTGSFAVSGLGQSVRRRMVGVIPLGLAASAGFCPPRERRVQRTGSATRLPGDDAPFADLHVHIRVLASSRPRLRPVGNGKGNRATSLGRQAVATIVHSLPRSAAASRRKPGRRQKSATFKRTAMGGPVRPDRSPLRSISQPARQTLDRPRHVHHLIGSRLQDVEYIVAKRAFIRPPPISGRECSPVLFRMHGQEHRLAIAFSKEGSGHPVPSCIAARSAAQICRRRRSAIRLFSKDAGIAWGVDGGFLCAPVKHIELGRSRAFIAGGFRRGHSLALFGDTWINTGPVARAFDRTHTGSNVRFMARQSGRDGNPKLFEQRPATASALEGDILARLGPLAGTGQATAGRTRWLRP